MEFSALFDDVESSEIQLCRYYTRELGHNSPERLHMTLIAKMADYLEQALTGKIQRLHIVLDNDKFVGVYTDIEDAKKVVEIEPNKLRTVTYRVV